MVVHALVREDGTVDGGELYEVAGLLGMSDQQVRLCVKRLEAEGRFAVEGRGRRAVLRMAVAAGAGPGLPSVPEVEFVRHAYRQDRGLEPWDGTWHAFAFAVPESARAARDSLRDALTGLGAAPVQGGLYVTPNAIGPYVRGHAAELGLPEALTCLTTRDLEVGGTADPVAVAARLWPLPAIAARYEPLLRLSADPGGSGGTGGTGGSGGPLDGPDAAGDGTARGGTAGARPDGDRAAGAAALARAVALASAFSAAMLPDPLLPPELLPRPWPGAVARAAAARAWDRLRADAPAGGPRLFRLYAEAAR
ncbi:PaaX family transcriptional regulator C-terminal domain-containing protein [Streptomyces antarcticus]|uniref:PaaX family transcriptional regulator C-terminal domain-containing protein n=1 Tax=Streptomyces antarcticus TaxID=2996458 RepID=UPI00227127AE|nr:MULTISPECIES: PaaX family transcriptional regulator C-terminal domain-containing protein [unclassified Streptomyces]MCY0947131.1 transcriptional regulator [Streptomyces sp. H34-AA3]MCZ4087346.1 transcriptional regulator [Streptomyces sp. H34-S5]